jgi:hypothetical protein
MGVSTWDVMNGRVGPDVLTAGRNVGCQLVTIVSGGASTDVQVNLPVGATLLTALDFTAVAATGAPTNANLSIGKTLGGAEYVAATDVKAAGKTALTFATGDIADILSLPPAAGASSSPSGNPSPVFMRLAFVGGTSPALTTVVALEYSMPYTAPTDGHGL